MSTPPHISWSQSHRLVPIGSPLIVVEDGRRWMYVLSIALRTDGAVPIELSLSEITDNTIVHKISFISTGHRILKDINEPGLDRIIMTDYISPEDELIHLVKAGGLGCYLVDVFNRLANINVSSEYAKCVDEMARNGGFTDSVELKNNANNTKS